MKTVALAVMRLQPLHNGHRLIIDSMLQEAQTAIVGIGSVQASDGRNPYSFEERRAMIEALYPGQKRLLVLGLKDIGAPTKAVWAAYVLDEIRRAGFPAPTCYYAGSTEDASWFEGALKTRVVNRMNEGGGINATAIREDINAGRDASDRVPQAVWNLIKKG